MISGSLPPGISLSSGGLLSGSSSTTGTHTFLVKATDAANGTRFDTRQFQFAVTPLSLTSGNTLPNAFVGSPYSTPLTVIGASGAVTMTVDPFNFAPPGLTLVQSGGEWSLAGTPTASGQFNFTIRISDGGTALTRGIRIFVYPASATPQLSVLQGSNLGTWMIGEVESQITATGGNGSYNWQVLSGSPPPGVSLRVPPDLAPWFPPSISAGLIGVATTPGVYTVTLRVTSGAQTLDVPFTMTITSLASDDLFSFPTASLVSRTLSRSPPAETPVRPPSPRTASFRPACRCRLRACYPARRPSRGSTTSRSR